MVDEPVLIKASVVLVLIGMGVSPTWIESIPMTHWRASLSMTGFQTGSSEMHFLLIPLGLEHVPQFR